MIKIEPIIVVSGGFDPIHSGHINYINAAKAIGGYLIVALNSDEWLKNKKGKYFMPFNERRIILENLNMVDKVLGFDDDDNWSASPALEKIKSMYPNKKIIFCNGGDRDSSNIREFDVDGVEFIFGVGGSHKANSSSSILKNYKEYFEERVWGRFFHLFNHDGVRVKDLMIDPGKGMSFQRHFKRNEIWLVYKGSCILKHSKDNPENFKEILLDEEDTIMIGVNEWHQVINPNKEPCHIIEIQYGEEVSEKDIERLYFYEKN